MSGQGEVKIGISQSESTQPLLAQELIKTANKNKSDECLPQSK